MVQRRGYNERSSVLSEQLWEGQTPNQHLGTLDTRLETKFEHGRYSCISPVSWWHLTLAKQSSRTNMDNYEQPHCQIAYRVEALVTSQEAGSRLEWSFEMLLKCTNIYPCKSYSEEITPCLLMPLTDCDCESR